MSERPTPKTDELRCKIYDQDLPNAVSYQEMVMHARKLERELGRIYHWIERRHQDGFIESLSYLANLDRVYDALHDRLDNALSDAKQADADSIRALAERNEAREQLAAERALADRLAGILTLYHADDTIAHYAGIADSLAAWKEARND